MAAAWLSLDETDSDLELFLRYFVAAIRTVFPAACAETLALLQAPLAPDQGVLLVALSNELEQLPGRLVLVLDDYHAIHGAAVHEFVGALFRHWPQRLHLVLIARSNPPLPLVQLRARGQVNVIRTRDLRFTPEETAAFLNKALAAPLSPAAVAVLDRQIEGWVAGLRLASLSLPRRRRRRERGRQPGWPQCRDCRLPGGAGGRAPAPCHPEVPAGDLYSEPLLRPAVRTGHRCRRR